MKYTWGIIGFILFWLLWPFWYIYFRLFPQRSRVLVILDSEVLLIRNWLGDQKWSLPGGGAGKGESVLASAVRELKEEVGIQVPETALTSLGEFTHTSFGLRFDAYYFSLELTEQAVIKTRWPEISEARWVKLADIRGKMLSKDAAYALKQYVPASQTTLL